MADQPAEPIEPVNAGHGRWFDVYATGNCMGHDVFVYYLTIPLMAALEEYVAGFGPLQFPFGRLCGLVKMDVPEKFQLSGILGTKELRITLRMNACPDTRERFEERLAAYSKNMSCATA